MKKSILTWILWILSLVAVATVIGCAGDNATPYSPIIGTTGGYQPPPDYEVSVAQVTPTQVLTFSPGVASTRGTFPIGATFQVTVKPLYGFQGTVTLASSNDQEASFFSTGFNPASVTLDSAQSKTTTFNVSLGTGNIQAGDYTFQVKGTSGTTTHTASTHPAVKVQLLGADFAVTLTPNTAQSIQAGSGHIDDTVTWTVTVAATHGFQGTVTLSNTNPDSVTFFARLDQPTLTLSTANPTATTSFSVELSADGLNHIGANLFKITGVSGTHSHNVTAEVDMTNIQD